MDRRMIQKGDLVNVRFEHIPNILGVRVLHRPQDVGDCWMLYDEKNDVPYNVQMFGTMELVERKRDCPPFYVE